MANHSDLEQAGCNKGALRVAASATDADAVTTNADAIYEDAAANAWTDGFGTWPLKRVAGSVHATDLEQAGCNKGALRVVASATDADDVTTNADAMYEFAAASGTDADAVTTNADAMYELPTASGTDADAVTTNADAINENAAANAWTDADGLPLRGQTKIVR